MRKYKLTKPFDENDSRNLIYGIISIFVGFICIIFQSKLFDYIGLILGIIMLVYGLIGIFKKGNQIQDILFIIFGCLFAFTGFFNNVVIYVILIISGLYLLISSISTITSIISLPNCTAKYIKIIENILFAILGVLLIVSGFKVMNMIFIILGIIAIINGVLIIIGKVIKRD